MVAEKLGRTREELLATISHRELVQWFAYLQIDHYREKFEAEKPLDESQVLSQLFPGIETKHGGNQPI